MCRKDRCPRRLLELSGLQPSLLLQRVSGLEKSMNVTEVAIKLISCVFPIVLTLPSVASNLCVYIKSFQAR